MVLCQAQAFNILIWVIDSHKIDMQLGKKVAIFHWERGRNVGLQVWQIKPWLILLLQTVVFEYPNFHHVKDPQTTQ